MKNKILNILLNSDAYVSGEKISKTLGISRNSIWKHINKLKNEGYVIDSVPNKGYKLTKRADVIEPSLISPNRDFIKEVIYFDEIDSTNNAAKKATVECNTLFIADCQTSGRGRTGREWASAKGCGIWMSIVTLPKISIEKIMQITLVTGIAVCETVNRMFGLDSQIKWPNDIVVDGKKLCGILTEAVMEEQTVTKIINGIGINVNAEKFPENISDTATSLYLITGNKSVRTDIVNGILDSFEKYYTMLIDKENMAEIIEKYKSLCVNIGKRVVSVGKNKKTEGTAIDISPAGELIIEKDDGTTVSVNAGEVSVRGIYGYI